MRGEGLFFSHLLRLCLPTQERATSITLSRGIKTWTRISGPRALPPTGLDAPSSLPTLVTLHLSSTLLDRGACQGSITPGLSVNSRWYIKEPHDKGEKAVGFMVLTTTGTGGE